MPAKTSDRPSARERLLNAANELFYEEGVHTVGIDRVIERAGVAKATLYSSFGSKEELVVAYLKARHEFTRDRMERELEGRFMTPREKLVGVFEIQGSNFVPGFRGCAFVGASAESPAGGAVEGAADEFRAWVRELFFHLAHDAGAKDPRALAQELTLLYDGAGLSAWMDRDPSAALAAANAAHVLVEKALNS